MGVVAGGAFSEGGLVPQIGSGSNKLTLLERVIFEVFFRTITGGLSSGLQRTRAAEAHLTKRRATTSATIPLPLPCDPGERGQPSAIASCTILWQRLQRRVTDLSSRHCKPCCRTMSMTFGSILPFLSRSNTWMDALGSRS